MIRVRGGHQGSQNHSENLGAEQGPKDHVSPEVSVSR